MNDRHKWVLLIVGSLIGLYVLAGLFSEWGEWHETGSGTATGYVTSVDTSGMVWRTTSVHFKTDAESTQEEWLCLRPNDRGLIETLRAFANGKTRVEFTYVTYLRVDWGECDSRFWNEDGVGVLSSVRAVQP